MKKVLFISVILFLFALPVKAADTGFLCPTTSTPGTGGFTNPSGMYTDCIEDGIYATETTDNQSEIYYNYGFSIPSGATINGVEATVAGYAENSLPINGDTIRITLNYSVNGGSTYSTGIANTWVWDGTATNSTNTFGGPTNLWGLTPTDTGFSNANFRMKVTVSLLNGTTETMFMDLMQTKVYYTTAGGVQRQSEFWF